MKGRRFRYRPHLPAGTRFWRRVIKAGKDNCWIWTGARDRDGYGLFLVKTSDRPDGQRICMHAQRFAWLSTTGPIPEGMHVLHRCDNPSCVNIEHLFLGTNEDNAADRHRKGRDAKGDRHGWVTKPERMGNRGSHAGMPGEANPSAKLTTTIVGEIRKDSRPGWVIAKEYGVSKSLIGAIRRREIWRATQS